MFIKIVRFIICMKTGIKVIDAMTEKPITVFSDIILKDCARIMADNHVGALMVKDDGKLQGVITEQDIVRKGVSAGLDPKKTKVSDIMAKELITIAPDSDIYEALIKMRDLNIRHLPVMDGSKMIGLLTLKDVLKIEPQLFDIMVEKFELREESRKPIHHISPNEGICESCGEYFEKLNKVDSSLLCDNCKAEQS